MSLCGIAFLRSSTETHREIANEFRQLLYRPGPKIS